MDCRLPGYSVYGSIQARILEWVALSSSRASSWPRDRTLVSHIGGWILFFFLIFIFFSFIFIRILYYWTTWEAQIPPISASRWYLFSDLLHLVWYILGPFMLLQMVLVHSFFYSWVYIPLYICGLLHGSVVKNLSVMQETQEIRVWSLGQEDTLEEIATHSSILAWKIPWTEESGGLQSMGSQRVGCDWATKHTCMQYDIVYVSCNFFIHSSVDGHVGCFRALWVMLLRT